MNHDAPQLLVDADGAGRVLSVKEQTFYKLRQREDFRRLCPEIRLGARAVRWHVRDLEAFVRTLATGERRGEPPQLAAGRARRAAANAGGSR